MPLREAGPMHEPPLCSQKEQAPRLAATATPEPEARTARNALGVVGIAGLATPRRVREIVPDKVALRLHGTAVAIAGFRGVGHRETDGARGARLRDVGRVVLRRIHREIRVVAAGAAHVGRVVPVLPDEGDAVQRILREVRLRAVLFVELRRALERIRLFAEAHRRLSDTKPAVRRWRHRISALQVTERSPRMFSVSIALTPPASGMPTRMPHCCCTPGSDTVGSMRPYSMGRPAYWSRSGMNVDAPTVWVGYVDRRAAEDPAGRRLDRFAVRRHERGARAVVCLDAVDVRLHHSLAGDLAILDRLVRAGDRRFFDVKGAVRGRRRASRRERRATNTARPAVSDSVFIAAPSPAVSLRADRPEVRRRLAMMRRRLVRRGQS